MLNGLIMCAGPRCSVDVSDFRQGKGPLASAEAGGLGCEMAQQVRVLRARGHGSNPWNPHWTQRTN